MLVDGVGRAAGDRRVQLALLLVAIAVAIWLYNQPQQSQAPGGRPGAAGTMLNQTTVLNTQSGPLRVERFRQDGKKYSEGLAFTNEGGEPANFSLVTLLPKGLFPSPSDAEFTPTNALRSDFISLDPLARKSDYYLPPGASGGEKVSSQKIPSNQQTAFFFISPDLSQADVQSLLPLLDEISGLGITPAASTTMATVLSEMLLAQEATGSGNTVDEVLPTAAAVARAFADPRFLKDDAGKTAEQQLEAIASANETLAKRVDAILAYRSLLARAVDYAAQTDGNENKSIAMLSPSLNDATIPLLDRLDSANAVLLQAEKDAGISPAARLAGTQGNWWVGHQQGPNGTGGNGWNDGPDQPGGTGANGSNASKVDPYKFFPTHPTSLQVTVSELKPTAKQDFAMNSTIDLGHPLARFTGGAEPYLDMKTTGYGRTVNATLYADISKAVLNDNETVDFDSVNATMLTEFFILPEKQGRVPVTINVTHESLKPLLDMYNIDFGDYNPTVEEALAAIRRAQACNPYYPLMTAAFAASGAAYDGTAFYCPVPKSARRCGEYGEDRGDHVHTGIDLCMPAGTPVHAVADGVAFTKNEPDGCGLYIIVEHGTNSEGKAFKTGYCHLSAYKVSNGQRVRRGDVIGLVGSTGHSHGPHLHFITYVEGGINGGRPNPTKPWEGCNEAAQPSTAVATSAPGASGQTNTAPPSSGFTVLLDPGHGIGDPDGGAPGEAELNLEVAQLTAALLKSRGIGAYLTRNGPNAPDTGNDGLVARAAMKKTAGASIMVSIHANAGGGSGTDAYYWGSNTAATHGVGPRTLKPEWELYVNGNDKNLAQLLSAKVASSLGFTNNGAHIHTETPLLLLFGWPGQEDQYGIEIPSALVELGYLDNAREKAVLLSSDGKAKAAAAIADAIQTYAATYPLPAAPGIGIPGFENILFDQSGCVVPSCGGVAGGSGGAFPGSGNDLRGKPSISIDLLKKLFAGSPPAQEPGFFECAYAAGLQSGIDVAWMAAWAKKENSFGKDKSGSGYLQKNLFGMSWGTQSVPGLQITRDHGFVKYVGPTPYCDSVKDWNAYVPKHYFSQGHYTPDLIIPEYAPASDGNYPAGYIVEIESWVAQWRAEQAKMGYAPGDASTQQAAASQATPPAAQAAGYSPQPVTRTYDSLGVYVAQFAMMVASNPPEYTWGGNDLTPESQGGGGIDCSGLVQQAYRKAGVSLTRTTWTMWKEGTAIPKERMDLLQPGDAVFFVGGKGPPPGHMGIYIGDNLAGKRKAFIHASSKADKVVYGDLTTYPGYMGARRFVQGGNVALPVTPIANPCDGSLPGAGGGTGAFAGGQLPAGYSPSGAWHENIMTSKFGCKVDNDDQPLTSTTVMSDSLKYPFAGLPDRKAVPTACRNSLEASRGASTAGCLKIEVRGPNGKSLVMPVLDVGPFNVDDNDYVFGSARPRRESVQANNRAGLDLNCIADNQLGVDGLGTTSWRFVKAG